jgi:hypothetical protein
MRRSVEEQESILEPETNISDVASSPPVNPWYGSSFR